MRLRKLKGVEEKIKELNNIIVENPTNYFGKWNQVFKNDNPIYLEIGMGKGKFIIEQAKKNPNINFIGCELSQTIIYKAAKQVVDVPNLFLINIDAFKLNTCFEKGEIKKIFLNFSDPWPKSRHEKRRLTSSSFLDVYKDILDENGDVEFKTDNRKLFEFSLLEFNRLKYDILDLSLDLHASDDSNIVTTEYEERFMALNQVIYYVKVRLK